MTDADWMSLALCEARIAALRAEIPVGCVLVDGALGRSPRELARAHNLRELFADPTAHAEVLAVRAAAAARGSWRLDGVTAYVTLEPCPRCAGAFVNARIDRVVYGCDDPRAGALKSLYQIGEDPRLNHRYQVVSGVQSEACALLLKNFFKELRKITAKGRRG